MRTKILAILTHIIYLCSTGTLIILRVKVDVVSMWNSCCSFKRKPFAGDKKTEEAVQWNLTTLDRNMTIISDGAEGESLVLGVSRDNMQQGEGKIEENERGFVEYEDDYQEGDLLPDPGLTVDYEDEGWHGWEEGLGGPGLQFKETFKCLH